MNARTLPWLLLLLGTVSCVRRDPLVGTWRQLESESGERITFGADGSYRVDFGKVDPALAGEPYIVAMRAMANVPGRYSRSAKTLVLTFDTQAVRKAVSGMPRKGPDTLKGDVFDQVNTYALSGDILEITFAGTTTPTKYVRVR